MSKNRRAIVVAVLGLALVMGLTTAAVAQLGSGGGSYALKDGERNFKLAGIPIPGYSEVLGFNLALVGMAYYKMDRHDDNLPPSATGLFGFYSANNSWMGGAFQKFHLDGDKWRATAAFMTGSIKYQFNPASVGPGFPDVFIDYTGANGLIFGQGARRVWDELYLGLAVLSWNSQVTFGDNLVEMPEERYTGPGVMAEWDQRNHTMYPTEGIYVDGRMLFFSDTFGSDRDFRKLSLGLRGYTALGDSTRVLAGRILQEGGYGDVPFSGQAMLNGNRNLRGYSNGRYRGNQLVTVEAEFRWMFWKRWGAAAFAGLGWVADAISDMSLGDTLPASGIGLRWRMIETFKINARIDYGWGQDDQGVYLSIGEAF